MCSVDVRVFVKSVSFGWHVLFIPTLLFRVVFNWLQAETPASSRSEIAENVRAQLFVCSQTPLGGALLIWT